VSEQVWNAATAKLLEVAQDLGYDFVLYVAKAPKIAAQELDEQTALIINAAGLDQAVLAENEDMQVVSSKKHLLAAGMALSSVLTSDTTGYSLTRYALAHAKAELAGMELLMQADEDYGFDEDDTDTDPT